MMFPRTNTAEPIALGRIMLTAALLVGGFGGLGVLLQYLPG